MTQKMKITLLTVLLVLTPFFSVFRTSAASSKLWVLIVCGAKGPSFHCDATYMHHVITHHIEFDGINYLSVVGDDPGVNETATKDRVRLAINTTLASNSSADDTVFIYFASHGAGYDAFNHTGAGGRNETQWEDEGPEVNGTGWVGVDEGIQIGDWPNDELYWDDELEQDLSYVQGRIIFVIQGCFSGGLIDDISANNRIIMSAASETWLSYGDMDGFGRPGYGFSEWSEHFMDALNGNITSYNLSNPPEWISESDDCVNADTNGDGQVSMKEAWDFAWNSDTARIAGLETPWFDDNGNGFPTYKWGYDMSDPNPETEGLLASQTFLPFKEDLAVTNVQPTVHYPLFQIWNGSMYNKTDGQNNTEVAMKYSATVTRKDDNDALSTVYANITLKRTNSSNYNDCYNITTISNQSFTRGQTRTFELVWNESLSHSLKQEPFCQLWNISCTVNATAPALFDVNLTNNDFYKETVEGRYLPGDCSFVGNSSGTVDILDAITLAGVYGRNDSSSNWNQLCTQCNFMLIPDPITGRQIIDIYDAIRLATYFGHDLYDMAGVRSSGKSGEGESGMENGLLGTTSLSVEPSTVDVFKNETFTVDVKLADVVDLYGWEFKLYWNNTVLNCMNVTINVPGIWQDTTQLYGPGLDNNYNATHGCYSKALTPTDPAPSFNGSMTLAMLTFKTIGVGTTQLLLQETKLGDSYAEPIEHTVTSGVVNAYYGAYMRSDTKTVNGLPNAYLLNATETTTYQDAGNGGSGTVAYWGIRAWVRHSNGTEQEVSLDGQTGAPKAVVSRNSGSGIQSATTSVSQTAMQTTDSLVVRVYFRTSNTSWVELVTFTTEQLGATTLTGTSWTLYYYTWAQYYRPFGYTAGHFYWGSPARNSRTRNLQYS